MAVMARYGDAADVASKVGRIMLRYRPIAPKPVTGGVIAAWPVDAEMGGRRGKRKGAGLREGGGRGRKSSRRCAAASVVVEAGVFREGKGKYSNINNNDHTFSSSHPVVALPRMPVTPERKDEETPAPTPFPTASDGHVAVSFFGRTAAWRQQQATTNNSDNNSSCSSSAGSGSSSVVVAPRPVRLVGSWVTVECVTDTWREGEVALASPAVLEKDTCPGFISDANDKVTWTNAAYRRMVMGPGGDEEGEEVGAGVRDHGGGEDVMRVALVTRGMVPAPEAGVTCFTCLVSVRYACRGRGKVSMAAPCDVWRLAGGRLAWRLDVKAALSLSLGS